MCKDNCEEQSWFYIDNRRAMVSLGPLNSRKTCPYSCAFCYVQDGFIPYAPKSIDEIVGFLVLHREKYDIIYVSGDTDSFAKPRNKQGILLLQSIAQKIDSDLLFTTRTVFDENDLQEIRSVIDIVNRNKKRLYACISITRYSESLGYLEPEPIPTPKERIDMLRRLHDIGAVTVLAMRPFLPVVPISDYIELLERVTPFIDIVLGEVFYFVSKGNIEKRVFPNGISKETETELQRNCYMDFDKNKEIWTVWQAITVERIVKDYCKKNGIIFSMRSKSAIDEYIKMKNS